MRHKRTPVVLVQRLARVAYTFLMMNYAAVQGLLAVATRKKVWR